MFSIYSFLLILIFTIITSLTIGWHARNWLGKPSPLEQSLKNELADLKKDLFNYEQEVNLHFKKTADLFNNLINHSKNLYEHLLQSSKILCRSPSDSEAVLSVLAEDKDKEHWEEIVLTAPSSNMHSINGSELDNNNWHPTYKEVSETKNEYNFEQLPPINEKK